MLILILNANHYLVDFVAGLLSKNPKIIPRKKNSCFFTALHVMQTRYCDENSVCPSVTRVDCDKTVERSVQIYIPYERTFILVF